MTEEGRLGPPIAEVEMSAARDALMFLAARASGDMERAIRRGGSIVGVGIEIRPVESVEQKAVRILRKAEIDACIQHAGAGVWVVEAGSEAVANRIVWVTDSDGDDDGCFFVGVYSDPFAEESIDSLSGCCDPQDLVWVVRRALTAQVVER